MDKHAPFWVCSSLFYHSQFNSTGSSQRKTGSQVSSGKYYPFILLKRQTCFSGKFTLILGYKRFFTWLDQIFPSVTQSPTKNSKTRYSNTKKLL